MKASEYVRKGWTQGEYARNSDGKYVLWSDPTAVCWCLDGALMAAYPGVGYSLAINKLRDVAPFNIIVWNDAPDRTKQEVIELLERAEV